MSDEVEQLRAEIIWLRALVDKLTAPREVSAAVQVPAQPPAHQPGDRNRRTQRVNPPGGGD